MALHRIACPGLCPGLGRDFGSGRFFYGTRLNLFVVCGKERLVMTFFGGNPAAIFEVYWNGDTRTGNESISRAREIPGKWYCIESHVGALSWIRTGFWVREVLLQHTSPTCLWCVESKRLLDAPPLQESVSRSHANRCDNLSKRNGLLGPCSGNPRKWYCIESDVGALSWIRTGFRICEVLLRHTSQLVCGVWQTKRLVMTFSRGNTAAIFEVYWNGSTTSAKEAMW
ncbi:hypothetical protein CEXT_326811 [Caerostris extrusa]|uniref:Uncharacterized protein n=1 Tax=Caerostris extrusa TaxID=172846 RepID=A0AAV4T3A6_CAEEX|nr:hypothetical protein CEXT_326811 [Caerostris extrusa]